MACTASIVCLFSTVSGCCKNDLGIGSISSGHVTKLEKSRISLDIYGLHLPLLPSVGQSEQSFAIWATFYMTNFCLIEQFPHMVCCRCLKVSNVV
jgi:hypothetical protein